MKKLRVKIFSFIISMLILVSYGVFAGDNVAYKDDDRMVTKTRQVAESASGTTVTITTTSTYIQFAKPTLSVTIINDDSTGTLYVNPKGTLAYNVNSSGGYTTAGSAEMDLNTPISTLGLSVGDLITLDEGDANDGVYSIVRIGTNNNKIYLDRALTVTHNANQDFILQSIPILYGESMTFDVGTQSLALLGSETATNARIVVTYQKG